MNSSALPPVALRVFETLPGNYLVLSSQLIILTASDEYLDLTGNSREKIAGRSIFEVFPQHSSWSAGSESNLETSLQQVIATRQSHDLRLTRIDTGDRNNGDAFKESHWQARHRPVLDDKGKLNYIIHEIRDISADFTGLDRPAAQVGTEAQAKTVAKNLTRQLEMLFHAIPAQIAIISGPDLVYTYINPQYQQELFPGRAVLGMPLLAALPEITNEPIWEILTNVYHSGQPYRDTEIRVPLAAKLGGDLEDHYFNVVYQPLTDEGGKVTAILSFKYEVTEHVAARKRLEESQQALHHLHAELQQAYQELQASNEELHSGNEELETTNEELKQAQHEWAVLNENLEDRIRKRTSALQASEREQQALNEELTAINEELSATNEELTDSQQRLEDTVRQLGISERKIKSLIASAPFPIGVYTGRELHIELLNQSIINTWNRGSDLIGKTYAEVLPELAGTGIYEILDQVYTTGVAYHAENERVDLLKDGALKPFYFNFDFIPLLDDKGQVYGIMNTAADVTDLVTAKLEAEQSRRNLYSIIMRSPVSKCILLGPQHTIDIVNDKIITLWGRTREAIKNKPIFEALPEIKGQGLEELLADVYRSGNTFEAKERPVTLLKDGRLATLFLDFVYQPYRDAHDNIIGVIATVIDVTSQILARDEVQQLNEELAATNEELKAANDVQAIANEELRALNAALKVSQDEVQLAIDAAALATFDLNPVTGRFTGNDLTKAWFGLQPEEEIDLQLALAAIAAPDRQRVTEAIQQALTYNSGGDYDVTYTILNPSEHRPRMIRAKGKALFNDLQQATRLSGVLDDVTEQKKDEQRKNDFIGIVSHELKTPLTSLKALIQVSSQKLRTSGDSFLQQAIEKTGIQISKMEAMINGFLNVSRLESGQLAIEKSRFDLTKLIATVIDETKLTTTGHQIKLLPGQPVEVNADYSKIESVISNLISNAAKYSKRATTITITCKVIADDVRVSVTDEGIGISETDQKHIFDRYFRVESSHVKHISGFGIGLYLSAEIIHRHGGTIGVQSMPEQGSTFYFDLPFVTEET